MDELGNPFLEDSKDLLALDTKDIMPERVVESVENAHKIGVSQYNSYMEDRLEKCLVAVTDTISKMIYRYLEAHSLQNRRPNNKLLH